MINTTEIQQNKTDSRTWVGKAKGRGRGRGEWERGVGGRGIMSEGGTSWRPHDGICKYDLFVSGMIEGR